jgi:hypothetical protein
MQLFIGLTFIPPPLPCSLYVLGVLPIVLFATRLQELAMLLRRQPIVLGQLVALDLRLHELLARLLEQVCHVLLCLLLKARQVVNVHLGPTSSVIHNSYP